MNTTIKNMKRLLSLVLVFAMMMTQFSFAATTSKSMAFTDVPAKAWYYSSVQYCFDKGYMSGTTDTTFQPTAKLNRGMMVTILWNMAGRPKTVKKTQFTDITNEKAYYYQAVQWAAAAKVVSGYADGSFGPAKDITREQLACMLMNYASYANKNVKDRADISGYADKKSVSSYAVNAVQWAIANKIISGKESGKYIDPKGSATRAEAASMIRSFGIHVTASGEKRVITIASWYDMYYTSADKDIYDNPNVFNEKIAQMQLDNVRAIEKKYNVEIRVKNMTWDGVIASLNTSVINGKPDADIYLVDMLFGVPAVAKGYATPIKDFAAKNSDIYTTKKVVKTVHTDFAEDSFIVPVDGNGYDVYGLGFNLDMIKAAGLENPQTLYDRGEWTWEVFMKYLKALTKDTDNDGTTDVYGYGGWWTTMLSLALMSNGADIAATTKQHLDDPKTVEVLNLIEDMYTKSKVAMPYNMDEWEANNYVYREGKTAFWTSAAWIADDGNDKDLPFETGLVPFPIGPSATKDTVYKSNVEGNAYIIPTGTKDPELVYNVLYDWLNWYQGDTTLRDDVSWVSSVYSRPGSKAAQWSRDYLLKASGEERQFDIWNNLSIGLYPLMLGDMSTKEFIDANKDIIQEELNDIYF